MVYLSRALLPIGPVAPVALHGDDSFRHGQHIAGLAEAQHVGGARIGVRFAVGHAHAAAGGDVPAVDMTGVVGNGDETKVVGEHVDVV